MKLLSEKLNTPIDSFDLLIKFSSFLLIYVSFFTTRIPFDPNNYADSFGAEVSNVKNQVVYLFLFFSSMVIFVKRYDQILTYIRSEKFLTIFVFLCLASALWTDYPQLSIKRSFQLFVTYVVVVESILFIEPKILLKQLLIVVSLYVFINLVSTRISPYAIDPRFGTWRGIEGHKNHLAQTGIYCLLSSIIFFHFAQSKWTKIYSLVLMLSSVFLIYKAHSSSAVIVIAMIVFLGFIFYIESIFNILKIGRSVLGFTFLLFLCLTFVFLIFSSEVFGLVPGYFGKDMTLSGRVPIWEYVGTEIDKKLFLGYGFAAYWIMGSTRILLFADYFEGFKVNQAHNGYLEIILQLGFIGFAFFLVLLSVYIYRMFKVNNNLAILVLISMLTLNFTESVLFKVGLGVTTFYFFAAYTLVSYYYFNPIKFYSDDADNFIDNFNSYENTRKQTNYNFNKHISKTSRY
jgi:exopolysaccharide production protein ExoQ